MGAHVIELLGLILYACILIGLLLLLYLYLHLHLSLLHWLLPLHLLLHQLLPLCLLYWLHGHMVTHVHHLLTLPS